MTTTWTAVDQKLDVFLNDPLAQNDDGTYRVQTYDRRLRINSWNWAQDIFVHHTPMQRRLTLTMRSGNREAILPEGWYAVEGIYDPDEGQWWMPMSRRPGYHQAEDETVLEYWVWDNRLYLQDSVSRDLVLYYWAYWPALEYTVGDNIGRENAPVYDIAMKAEQILVPRWAEIAMIHLTCASCLVPGAIEASDINQWKVWIDAGNPEHNPRLQQAWYHMQMYDNIMTRVPPAYSRRDVWQ